MNTEVIEFRRDGIVWGDCTPAWQEAVDSAVEISRELVTSSDDEPLWQRINALAGTIAQLDPMVDDVDVPVRLQPVRGVTLAVPLTEVPKVLRSLLVALPN